MVFKLDAPKLSDHPYWRNHMSPRKFWWALRGKASALQQAKEMDRMKLQVAINSPENKGF